MRIIQRIIFFAIFFITLLYMSKQIFKKQVDKAMVLNLLEKINVFKTDKYYTYNKNSFKKALYLGCLEEFIESCKEYYHSSKQKYLEGEITQKRLTTIIRQLCKCAGISYTSKIQYDKSVYDIYYYIYYNQ